MGCGTSSASSSTSVAPESSGATQEDVEREQSKLVDIVPTSANTPSSNSESAAAQRVVVGDDDDDDDDDSEWARRGGKLLEPQLECTTLLSLRWLNDLVKQRGSAKAFGGILPANQHLPPEARVSLEALKSCAEVAHESLPVVAVSYPWWTPQHPDPDGKQIKYIEPILDALKYDIVKNGNCPEDTAAMDWGVFWDFCALPQHGYTASRDGRHVPFDEGDDRFREIMPGRFDDRTDEEQVLQPLARTPQKRGSAAKLTTPRAGGRATVSLDFYFPTSRRRLARFKSALCNINIWYSHHHVITVHFDVLPTQIAPGGAGVVPYERRGWCQFEQKLARALKMPENAISLSVLFKEQDRRAKDEGSSWPTPPEYDADGSYTDSGTLFSDLQSVCLDAPRAALMPPPEFNALLRDGVEDGSVHFTSGSDLEEVVIPNYKKGFLGCFLFSPELSYRNRAGDVWTEAEALQMIEGFEYAHANGALAHVTDINFEISESIGNRAMAALCELLRSGALPKLKSLELPEALRAALAEVYGQEKGEDLGYGLASWSTDDEGYDRDYVKFNADQPSMEDATAEHRKKKEEGSGAHHHSKKNHHHKKKNKKHKKKHHHHKKLDDGGATA